MNAGNGVTAPPALLVRVTNATRHASANRRTCTNRSRSVRNSPAPSSTATTHGIKSASASDWMRSANAAESTADIRFRLTSIDRNRGAADPARARGGEECDRRSHFFGPTHPAERQIPLDELGASLRVRLLPFVPGAAGKHNRARRDAVHPDI